ncbi:MAG TPA: RluA family pseudouridine synthase [Lacibacter sp.]|nr:RluA family pseudouridine synthase [Lacibacter sp.]HMO88878.1 RluA family pseudouridine synthase [Lacibacter sp.]HMP87670.1 RluA family pseudouridine synthase [Lacibacter sp.]
MKNKPDILALSPGDPAGGWIAVNKPAGLLSIPDREQSEPSLKDLLQERYGKVWVVHRLDKMTSGLILFARDEATHKHLSQQFEDRTVEKYYQGLVHGVPYQPEGSVDAPIMENPAKKGTYLTHQKGKSSQTDFRVVQSYGRYAWLEFRIHTGRTHQIRVHMKHIGHPIVCDDVYGTADPLLLSSLKGRKFKLSKSEEQERPLLNRLALHAWKIRFKDLSGEVRELEAPLPKDLRAVLQQLGKWK